MNYLLHLLILFDIYAIVALSLNLVVGYSGLLTLAHAAYFAVGAYGYALATLTLGWSFIPALAAGTLVAVALSLMLSIPAWRFSGDFFVLVSLSVGALLFSAFYNWHDPAAPLGSWSNLTNGPYGIGGIPRPAIAGRNFATLGSMVVVATSVMAVCALLLFVLTHSPWGRLLKVVRDDELAARSLGKRARTAKVQSIAASCGLAAVGGAVYASYVSYIDPQVASLDASILLLSMVAVGGSGNFRGPLTGVLVLLLIPELLRFVEIADALAPHLRLMAYGVLLVALMHLRPQGIAGEYRLE